MEGAEPEATQGCVRVHRVPELLRAGEARVPGVLGHWIRQQQGAVAETRIERALRSNVSRANPA